MSTIGTKRVLRVALVTLLAVRASGQTQIAPRQISTAGATNGWVLTNNGGTAAWVAGGGGGGAVSSVFGRTGAVVAGSGDYTTNLVTESVNLYFTDARARSAVSVSGGCGTYNGSTGVFDFTGCQAAGATVVLTNQSNTWSTGDQDMSAATALRLPTAALGTTAGRVRYNPLTGRMEWYDAVGGATRAATFLPAGLAANDVLFASSSTALGRSANFSWNNGASALNLIGSMNLFDAARLRVELLPGGGAGAGTINTYDTLGTTLQNQMASTGVNTTIGYNVGGVPVISSARNGTLVGLTLTGTANRTISSTSADTYRLTKTADADRNYINWSQGDTSRDWRMAMQGNGGADGSTDYSFAIYHANGSVSSPSSPGPVFFQVKQSGLANALNGYEVNGTTVINSSRVASGLAGATITQAAAATTPLTVAGITTPSVPFLTFTHADATWNWSDAAGGAIRINPTLALANTPDVSGTVIGMNMPSTFTGNCLDLQRGGAGAIRVTCESASPQTQISDLRVMNTSYGGGLFIVTGANNGRPSTVNLEATGQGASNATMGIPYFRAGAAVTSASNSGTVNILVTPVSGALYRLSYYCYVTTPEASRTASVVIGWSDDTVGPTAQTSTVCNAVSTNTMGTTVSGSLLLATNSANPITYAITYTLGSTGVLRMRYTLERLQ